MPVVLDLGDEQVARLGAAGDVHLHLEYAAVTEAVVGDGAGHLDGVAVLDELAEFSGDMDLERGVGQLVCQLVEGPLLGRRVRVVSPRVDTPDRHRTGFPGGVPVDVTGDDLPGCKGLRHDEYPGGTVSTRIQR